MHVTAKADYAVRAVVELAGSSQGAPRKVDDIAQAQSILMEPSGAALAGASGAILFWTTVPALGGAAIGIKIIEDDRRKTPLSPS